ncbi:hypothetical protein [Treponema sp. R80B11-R83G3]
MTNRITLFVFLTASFLFSRPLWAQSSSSGGGRYVIEQRYVQTIEWIGDKYTIKYEIVIEKNEDGNYKTYIREFTEKPSVQVSLPLGKYRYRIIPYDYLEHPGDASDWINIEIKPAPIARVEVQKADDGSYILQPYEDEQTVPSVNETNKLFNLYVSASWTPLIPIYGRIQEIFGNEFYTAGASVRFGVLYNKLRWFNPGIELSTSWYALNNAKSIDTVGIKTGVTGFNIVAQKPLPHRMAVTLKAGAAILFQVSEINIEDYSFSLGGLIPQINLEASFLWFAYKQLYLEAGIGFHHLFNKPGNSGCLRPWIGAGWQF